MPYKDKEVARQKARERWLKNKDAISLRKKARYYQDLDKTRENNRVRYEKHKFKILENQKQRRKTFTGWRKMAWQSARARTNRQGIEFSITENDIPEVPEVCPILGIPLEFGTSGQGAASLDRIDNTRGYIKNNLQIISDRANRLKRDATLHEMILLGEWAAAKQIAYAAKERCNENDK